MREIIVLLGQADSVGLAPLHPILLKATVSTAFAQVNAYWGSGCAIEIKTPDRAMNTIMNRWLLTKRFPAASARSALYQSGGAWFMISFKMSWRWFTNHRSLGSRSCGPPRQFEGDVHRWHPPLGRRADVILMIDLAALCRELTNATGDRSVLSEVVSSKPRSSWQAPMMPTYSPPRRGTGYDLRTLRSRLDRSQNRRRAALSSATEHSMNRLATRAGECLSAGSSSQRSGSYFCDGADQAERAR